MTPTARALKSLRELGFIAGVVERYNPHTKKKNDLFGFIDIVSAREGVGILFVQATSGSHHAARVTKIRASDEFAKLIASGGRVEVWSYAKRGARGKRKTWTLRREELRLDNLVFDLEQQ